MYRTRPNSVDRRLACRAEDVQESPTRLLSAAQMQAVDARAVAQGLDSFALMTAAGEAVAAATIDLLVARPGRVLVMAGPGNNGGDGAVAARALHEQGHRVCLWRFVSRSDPSPATQGDAASDAERAFADWQGETHHCRLDESQLPPSLAELIARADVIVDALFGAGLSRPLEGVLAEVVALVNASVARVLAVDVPSGLDGNSHQVSGACIEATATVTFFLFKPAHFLYPGRALCGDKTLAQIGLGDAQLDPAWPVCQLNEPAAFEAELPVLSNDGHKFDRGHVLVRSGPMVSTGAARLSAHAALYCGAGLVTLASQEQALAVNAAHLTAVMLKHCDTVSQWRELLQDSRINTVVVGPGNGVDEHTRGCTLESLAAGKRCVLDADALSCWTDAEDRRSLFQQLQEAAGMAVLTPHGGEFRRLFPELSAEDRPGESASRLHLARQAARRTSAVLVYKGADTVIAAPDGRAAISANAPPWLATAGAGDVLAGVIASLMAQGMPAFEAACAAVWLHGQAASDLQYPISAEQLLTRVPDVLRSISPVNR
ncbi:NAD(P)H-hydrate dehydratase [Granulosicoccus sp. 3-233]|uniref:NAD(P)H-hydrate dehydratase n=1 Tax=Granulosicoccus sp. 3-233 TaxID=3417969 RepID=UPI003D324FDE